MMPRDNNIGWTYVEKSLYIFNRILHRESPPSTPKNSVKLLAETVNMLNQNTRILRCVVERSSRILCDVN